MAAEPERGEKRDPLIATLPTDGTFRWGGLSFHVTDDFEKVAITPGSGPGVIVPVRALVDLLAVLDKTWWADHDHDRSAARLANITMTTRAFTEDDWSDA
jgi:hypothetical protein